MMLAIGIRRGLPRHLGLGTARLERAMSSKIALPSLPYAYDALAPVIIPEIMEIHHSKHHQAYVNGFNAALEELREVEATGNVDKIVSLQSAIKFNGGGGLRAAVGPSNGERAGRAWGMLGFFKQLACLDAKPTGPASRRAHQPRDILEEPDSSLGRLQDWVNCKGLMILLQYALHAIHQLRGLKANKPA